MAGRRVGRSWRLADGDVLVAVEGGWASDYYRLAGSRLVDSYVHSVADDCELMYIFGYRVVDGRFEHVTEVEVGYPYRRDVVSVGDRILDGLVELPDGSVPPARLVAAGITDVA